MRCDAHLVVLSTSVVGMNTKVLKNDQLKVLVVPSLPLTLLVSNKRYVCYHQLLKFNVGSINQLNSFNLKTLLFLW